MINKIIFLVFVFSLTNSLVFTQWVQQNSGTTGDLKSVFFVNPLTGWVCGVTGSQSTDRIAKTTDGGTSWVKQNAGTFYVLNAIQFINDQTGWAAGLHGTVVKTTNGGANWFVVFGTTSWDWDKVQFISVQTGWVAGIGLNGMYLTTDGGFTWNYLVNSLYFRDFHFTNNLTGYAVRGDSSIYNTSNGGINWTATSFGNTSFAALHFATNLDGFAVGEPSKVARTTNAGLSWDTTRISNSFLSPRCAFFINKNCGHVAGYNGIIYSSKDQGLNWVMQPSNVNSLLRDIFFTDTMNGWTVGDNGVLLKTTNGGGPVGLEQTSSELPENFSLAQNYPNPFNPATVIKFNIANRTSVRIRIFNIQGKEIDIPVNQFVNPGGYQIAWNGANFPSGVYFYRFETEYFAETRKMILIK